MEIETMEDFYLKELKDVADAERQLMKALPKMAKAATTQELRQAFEIHTRETQEQLRRIEKILKNHGESASGPRCKGMQGIISEGEEFLEEEPDEMLIDVGLITSAQKVEHYEIATYGCLTTYARLLGLEEDARLLHRTLAEEKATDGKLSLLAEDAGLNEEAASGETPEDLQASENEEQEGDQEMETSPRSKRQAGRGGKRAQSARGASNGGRARGGSQQGKQSRRGGSRASASSRGRDGAAQSTKDLEEIRAWAEERGGKPATVKSTRGKRDGAGILRIDFPGYSGAGSLEEISWDEWYQKFQENNLTFLYQDRTKDGQQSRFFKLVCAPKGGRRSTAKSGKG
jgi:ferritin-like metal-binding protein YciE